MKKMVLSILGEDRPGIVYAVSRVLFDLACNILEVSQTILQTEFAGIFIIAMPAELTAENLSAAMEKEMEPLGLKVGLKDFKVGGVPPAPKTEPFVITVRGEDRLGIIPGITGVIAGFDINIVNLKAIADLCVGSEVVIVFEVDIPDGANLAAFRAALQLKAEELNLEISIQHREIFEAIHRI
ncbi:MAG: ACT domain-containing protein [Pseudomonadota bacterium]